MSARTKPRVRTGYLYKLGDGPINFDWNQRYCLLDSDSLSYFNHPTDRNCRGHLELRDATVSQLSELKGHPYSFTVTLPNGKVYHFSHPDFSEAENWRQQMTEAAVEDKVLPDEVYQESLDLNKYQEADDRKSRKVRRGSVGEVPADMKNALERVQGEGEDWRLKEVRNGVRIEVLNWREFDIDLRDKLKKAGMILGLYFLLTYFWLSNLVAFLVLLPLLLREARKVGLNAHFDAVRGSTIISASSKDIFSVVMDLDRRPLWDPMISKSNLIESIDSHTDHIYAEFLIPDELKFMHFWRPRSLVMKRYWMVDQTSNYIVVGKTCPHPKADLATGQIAADYFEGVVISPVEENRCLVAVTISLQLHGWETEFVRERVCFQRAEILVGISEFTLYSLFEDNATSDDLATVPSQQSPISLPRTLLEDSENSSILYNDGSRVSLEVRLPGYARDKRGGIKCVNKQELDSQKGIILELIAKAGKQLMEGKNVVGVSLPVRIFEPRSTLERMVDWWCTAPKYLMAAANARDPLERFKQVVTFAISGLYYGTRQLKPFNPVLGETYQGKFPDGADISIEHTSHHPPIAQFFKQMNPKKRERLFRFICLKDGKEVGGIAPMNVRNKQMMTASQLDKEEAEFEEIYRHMRGTTQPQTMSSTPLITSTRFTAPWQPSAILCQRFNVPEPSISMPQPSRKQDSFTQEMLPVLKSSDKRSEEKVERPLLCQDLSFRDLFKSIFEADEEEAEEDAISNDINIKVGVKRSRETIV